MKKLFAIAIAMSLAGAASAASIGFDFGTNFYKPAVTGYTTENGENFALSWNLDSDVSLGIYTETSNFSAGTAATTGTLAVSAVQVTKGVMKNVNVGLAVGSATSTIGAVTSTAPMVDIVGTVDILSGSGDKISGALRASAAARFCQADLENTAAAFNEADGVNLGLAVQVAF
jgi:hypothetical protein